MLTLAEITESTTAPGEDRADLETSYTEACQLLSEASDTLKSVSKFLKKNGTKESKNVRGKLESKAAELDLFIEQTE